MLKEKRKIMGLLHIYCGDGKGKTTAAIGLAVRAAGAGMKVCFVQLMKGRDTSELSVINHISDISVKRCDKDYGFFRNMTDNDKAEITACHNEMLKNAFKGDYDMIILDEFNSAYHYGLLDKEFAKHLILNGREYCETVLTGRNPDEVFLKSADYVSEICCVRHPYKKGISARKGIEY